MDEICSWCHRKNDHAQWCPNRHKKHVVEKEKPDPSAATTGSIAAAGPGVEAQLDAANRLIDFLLSSGCIGGYEEEQIHKYLSGEYSLIYYKQ